MVWILSGLCRQISTNEIGINQRRLTTTAQRSLIIVDPVVIGRNWWIEKRLIFITRIFEESCISISI